VIFVSNYSKNLRGTKNLWVVNFKLDYSLHSLLDWCWCANFRDCGTDGTDCGNCRGE
jgi:hypothetical protein